MSSMKSLEKTQCEDFLGMASGYVLDLTNRSFAQLVQDHAAVNIYADKYAGQGDSKAKRLRMFWEIEPDQTVGQVLIALLDYWQWRNPTPDAKQQATFKKIAQIADRLAGKSADPAQAEKMFLSVDFSTVSLSKAKVDATLLPILEARLAEATRCLQAQAFLSVIFMCGSVLEGMLLSVACTNPQKFNQAPNSPKEKGTLKVKSFPEWKLAELIDVSCEVGYLKPDIKKFSHSLREFRNYVHPHQQLTSQFSPDKHTAEICMQVLKAAIACLGGTR